MTLEEVTKAVHAVPFAPFTLFLADGLSIRVPHPDFISLPPTGRTVAIYQEEERAHAIVDLLLATKLETSASPEKTNR